MNRTSPCSKQQNVFYLHVPSHSHPKLDLPRPIKILWYSNMAGKSPRKWLFQWDISENLCLICGSWSKKPDWFPEGSSTMDSIIPKNIPLSIFLIHKPFYIQFYPMNWPLLSHELTVISIPFINRYIPLINNAISHYIPLSPYVAMIHFTVKTLDVIMAIPTLGSTIFFRRQCPRKERPKRWSSWTSAYEMVILWLC